MRVLIDGQAFDAEVWWEGPDLHLRYPHNHAILRGCTLKGLTLTGLRYEGVDSPRHQSVTMVGNGRAWSES